MPRGFYDRSVKTGRWKHTSGYVCLVKPDHPFCDKRGRVFEHRYVMEKKLGRYLTESEIVHHINGVKNDNRPENLGLFSNNSEHLKHEWELNPQFSESPFKIGHKPPRHKKGCHCFRCDKKAPRNSFEKGRPPAPHKNPNCKCFRCAGVPFNKK